MQPLRSVPEAKRRALQDVRRIFGTIRRLAASHPATLQGGLDVLREIRKAIYEDLNQVQHECLILEASEWLTAHKYAPRDARWYWNPRQTGTASEPDLSVTRGGVQLVAAEVTTSERPAGVIDSRMAATLRKLAAMAGSRFYFVRTMDMKKRAETKVRRQGWRITVVSIDTLPRSDRVTELFPRTRNVIGDPSRA